MKIASRFRKLQVRSSERSSGTPQVEAHADDARGGAAVTQRGTDGCAAVDVGRGSVVVVGAVSRAREALPHVEGKVDGIVEVLPLLLGGRQAPPVVAAARVEDSPAVLAVPAGAEVDLDEAGEPPVIASTLL